MVDLQEVIILLTCFQHTYYVWISQRQIKCDTGKTMATNFDQSHVLNLHLTHFCEIGTDCQFKFINVDSTQVQIQ